METKFNFKSQPCTSREQSERLLALGLKKETADCTLFRRSKNAEWEISTDSYIDWVKEILPLELGYTHEDIFPAWSLGRLLEMLPSPIQPKEELPSYSGYAYLNLAQIAVWYDYTDYDMDDRTLISWSGNGFFSAVVEAIVWLIKEGYFNKEYLV